MRPSVAGTGTGAATTLASNGVATGFPAGPGDVDVVAGAGAGPGVPVHPAASTTVLKITTVQRIRRITSPSAAGSRDRV
ncbi:uncharacterized protein RMCC_6678 [Mycolicibacterium canariasense]|uniref:Uncharacterized protein n=1 Tax=Mycolicibacterium canariasense TaxID=228230 RepID=A0A100WKW7_MYCCR|nr:uncharacterized protein RMCC_6678 [Mycolicibacterium canariasense]